MEWLRLDVDITRDLRIRRLPVVQRWAWIAVLTLAAQQRPDGQIPWDARLLADEANISPGEAERALEQYARLDLIERCGDMAIVVGWKRIRASSALLRMPADLWRVVRALVFQRDDYTCRYCGERGGRLECDHILPVSRGGTDDLQNLTTACFACNRSKRAKTPEEWLR
jgi:hypothetical protein